MNKNTLLHLIILLFLSNKMCLGKAKNQIIAGRKNLIISLGNQSFRHLAELLFWPIPGIQLPLVVAWLLGGAVFFTLK